MSIFSKLINGAIPPYKKAIPVLSPLNGQVVTLDKVPFQLFQQRLLGEGIAIQPSGYKLLAPFDGKVEFFPPTHQQIRVKAANGLKMLIQIGIGGEKLMGEGYKSRLKTGDQFKQGDCLIEFDLRKIKPLLESTLCPVTILNSHQLIGIKAHCHQVMANEDVAFTAYV